MSKSKLWAVIASDPDGTSETKYSSRRKAYDAVHAADPAVTEIEVEEDERLYERFTAADLAQIRAPRLGAVNHKQ